MPEYFIKKFRSNAGTTVVRTGLTLEEAQEWCNRKDTHGVGWFYGYTSTDSDDPSYYPQEDI